jgi:hypothetical protein
MYKAKLQLSVHIHSISCDFRTMRATFFLNPSLSSRHCFAASMFAGDSSFGEDSIEMMEIMMDSTCMMKQKVLLVCNDCSCCTHMNSISCLLGEGLWNLLLQSLVVHACMHEAGQHTQPPKP